MKIPPLEKRTINKTNNLSHPIWGKYESVLGRNYIRHCHWNIFWIQINWRKMESVYITPIVFGVCCIFTASASSRDLFRDIGRSPCTHCFFRRRTSFNQSFLAFNTYKISTHSTFCHGMLRPDAVHIAGISSEDYTFWVWSLVGKRHLKTSNYR